MESLLLSARHFLWSTARGYQSYTEDAQIWNETSASKVVVMNQGIEIVDLAMRIVGAKSLEMSRPLQRYYRDIRAGLHNPPMEDMATLILLKVLQTNFNVILIFFKGMRWNLTFFIAMHIKYKKRDVHQQFNSVID